MDRVQHALSDLELHLKGPLEDFSAYARSEKEHRMQRQQDLDVRLFDQAVELVSSRIRTQLETS